MSALSVRLPRRLVYARLCVCLRACLCVCMGFCRGISQKRQAGTTNPRLDGLRDQPSERLMSPFCLTVPLTGLPDDDLAEKQGMKESGIPPQSLGKAGCGPRSTRL